MKEDVFSQGGMPVTEDPIQGLLHRCGTPGGKNRLAWQCVLYEVLKQRSSGGICKAVRVRPAGERAALQNIPELHPGRVFDMPGMPMIGQGAGMQA